MQSRVKQIILEEIKKQLADAKKVSRAPIYIDLLPGEGYARYYKGPGTDEKPSVKNAKKYTNNNALGVKSDKSKDGWVGQPGGAAAEFGRSGLDGIARGPEFKTRPDLAKIERPRKPKNLKEDDADDYVTDNDVIPKEKQKPNSKHNRMYNLGAYSRPASSRDQGKYVGSDLGDTRLNDKTAYLYLDMIPVVARRNRNIRQYLILNKPELRIKDKEGRVLVPFKDQTDTGTKIVVRRQYKGSLNPNPNPTPKGEVPDTKISNPDLQKPIDKKTALPVRDMKSNVGNLQTIYNDLADRKNLLKQYLFDAGVNVGNLDRNINTSDVKFDDDELAPQKSMEDFEDSLENMSKSKLASNYEDVVLKMSYIIRQVQKADTKVNALKVRGIGNKPYASDLSI
jgi:hypothetical protein